MMRNLILFVCVSILFFNCGKEVQTKFSDEVLSQEYLGLDDQPMSFKAILSQYEGQQIVIDVWASWCKDCIVGLPKVEALQASHPDAIFLFLSADRNTDTWKRSIEKFNIKGEHYFLPNGTKGAFGKFVDIDWIPRYMLVDSKGNIEVFDVIEADDPLLINSL